MWTKKGGGDIGRCEWDLTVDCSPHKPSSPKTSSGDTPPLPQHTVSPHPTRDDGLTMKQYVKSCYSTWGELPKCVLFTRQGGGELPKCVLFTRQGEGNFQRAHSSADCNLPVLTPPFITPQPALSVNHPDVIIQSHLINPVYLQTSKPNFKLYINPDSCTVI